MSFAFAPFTVRSGYLTLLFFLSSSSQALLTAAPLVLKFPSRLSLSSPFCVPWFPKRRSRFQVLGDLLVSFHPTQLRSRSRSTGDQFSPPLGFLPCLAMLPLSFVRFRLGPDYSAFCFFRSLPPGFPSQRFFPVPPPSFNFGLSALPSACFHASVPALVLGVPAIPFSASLLRVTGATATSGLLFPARPLPLAFALGSGTWAGHVP